jgi:hypothetical protein
MLAVGLLASAAALLGSSAQEEPEDQRYWSADLIGSLRERGWEPPYFEGTVRSFPDGYHLDLAKRALREATTPVTVGRYTYRTSPALIGAGREIFRTYHFGTQRIWDFRRAIDWSTGVTDPAEYGRRYGVQRDREGYFVGIIGVKQSDGHVVYGHSCALCHSNVDARGTILDGAANEEYDIGLYYDALRSKIRDVDLVYLGDAPLKTLRLQGPGRTDPTMDSFWAPVRVPHLFALRAFADGYRSNGDTANLWLQCYRNLNGDYAVDFEIMEALMAFLLSIEAPRNPRPVSDIEKKGAGIFKAQSCDRCHAPPYYSTGRLIDWDVIRTDPDRIQNGWPKGYKVPSLLRLDMHRLFLHDGSLTSLDQLFDPGRLNPAFGPPGIPGERRKIGSGVPGHDFGLELSKEDRAALVAYLRTL